MRTALIPGSFDPVTVGHLDIIKRACLIFDNVTVLVANNEQKSYLLSDEARFSLVKDALKNIKNASVDIYDGLLVDYVAQNGQPTIVKGVRNVEDFLYEQNMALFNSELSMRKYNFLVETMFLTSDIKYAQTSSSLVRVLIQNNADFKELVPNYELLLSYLK